MNFTFMTDGEFPNEDMRTAYEEIEKELEKAEALYWKKPQQCGVLLRKTAEKICRLYNCHYSIGFPNQSSLEEFLCYTDNNEHNVLVSRFLSVVRKDQRDRLNRLRAIGDDCIWGEEGPNRGMELNDRMAQDAQKMMDTMMEVIKSMCTKLNGRTDVNEYYFYENEVPGFSGSDDRFPKPPEPKKSFLARLFSH